MNHLVSIIVPIYKSENYLCRCVDSIIQQTYKNIEVILVDDGSPDNSGMLCDKYAEMDSRIKVIHKINGGVSSSRNIGLKNATGEYIQFVDSDDYLEKTMVECLVKSALSNNSDIVMCGYNQIENNTIFEVKVGATEAIYTRDAIITYLLNAASEPYFNPPWNKLFKAKVIGDNLIEFNTAYSLGEDFIFNLDVIQHSRIISIVPEALYNYLAINSDSLTRKYRPNMWENQYKMFIYYKDFFVRNSIYQKYISRVNAFILMSIKIYLSYLINTTKSIRYKKECVKIIIEDPLVIETLKVIQPKDITSRIVLFCILHKLVNILVSFYNTKLFIYKKFTKAYHLLKKYNYLANNR